jgi:hypothetical protein
MVHGLEIIFPLAGNRSEEGKISGPKVLITKFFSLFEFIPSRHVYCNYVLKIRVLFCPEVATAELYVSDPCMPGDLKGGRL